MKCVRSTLVLLAPLLLARCSSNNADLAPIEWQKVPGLGPNGSVLPLGPPGSFDEVSNFTISAFKDGDIYKLYYGGADTATTNPNCAGINGVHWRIGLATSSDGFNWTRIPGSAPAAKQALLDIGAAGNFDSFLTYDIQEAGNYYIEVTAVYPFGLDGIPNGVDYQLNISIPQHVEDTFLFAPQPAASISSTSNRRA